MKKKFVLLIPLLLLVLSLTACSSSKTTSNSVDNYHMFETKNVEEYFNFLENFDDSKYVIIDITTARDGGIMYYFVTYKNSSETE